MTDEERASIDHLRWLLDRGYDPQTQWIDDDSKDAVRTVIKYIDALTAEIDWLRTGILQAANDLAGPWPEAAAARARTDLLTLLEGAPE